MKTLTASAPGFWVRDLHGNTWAMCDLHARYLMEDEKADTFWLFDEDGRETAANCVDCGASLFVVEGETK